MCDEESEKGFLIERKPENLVNRGIYREYLVESLSKKLNKMASKNLTKRELIELLRVAKTSSERNKAVKLLKRFTPNPNYAHDEQFDAKEAEIQELNFVTAFLCFRCNSVKQTNTKVNWRLREECAPVASSSADNGNSTTSKTSKKIICIACYNQLLEQAEVAKLRRKHHKEGLIPKGLGFGLTDTTKDYTKK